MKNRGTLSADTVPHFTPGARLQYDKVRAAWIIQAPERYFELDAVATEIVKRIDGATSVEVIVGDLAALYNAPKNRIFSDVSAMLQDLFDKGVLAA